MARSMRKSGLMNSSIKDILELEDNKDFAGAFVAYQMIYK